MHRVIRSDAQEKILSIYLALAKASELSALAVPIPLCAVQATFYTEE